MKGIKVVDIGCEPEETQFGTCDLCFSYGVADNPYMVLEFPDGLNVQINTYYWDWGDYNEFGVGNVVDFSGWLREQELSDADYLALREGDAFVLMNLIDDYNYRQEEDECPDVNQ